MNRLVIIIFVVSIGLVACTQKEFNYNTNIYLERGAYIHGNKLGFETHKDMRDNVTPEIEVSPDIDLPLGGL